MSNDPTYSPSPFVKAFESGAIVHLDEVDCVDEISDDGVTFGDGRYLSFDSLAEAIESLIAVTGDGRQVLPNRLLDALKDCKFHF